MTRNDNRYVEDMGLSFAIYCDTNGLSYEERQYLAEEIDREISQQAEYVSPHYDAEN